MSRVLAVQYSACVDHASVRHIGRRWRTAALVAGMTLLGLAGCSSTGDNQPKPQPIPQERPMAQRQEAPDPRALPDSPQEGEQRRRARIRTELGASYFQQGNLKVALDELRQALDIDPGYAPAYSVRGLIYMQLKESANAEESFQRGLKLTPDDSDLNNNYGWFLCESGRAPQSIQYFDRASRNPLYSRPGLPLHNAGLCSLRVGDEVNGESYMLRAFQVDPADPVAMYHLARIYLKRGDLTKARFYVQRLLSSYDPTAEALWLALRVERAGGNRDSEASYAAQLRRRFPQSRETSLLMNGRYDN